MSVKEPDVASAVPRHLDALPRLDGFRLRGIEMTRLETFIDAAFAFAITMLVIAGDQAPNSLGEVLAAFRDVPAFVASIAVLGSFWRGHWLWSRRFGLEDGRSITISWGLLVTILIYIYPLKIVFNGMCFFLTDGAVGRPMGATTAEEVRQIFALFAAGFTTISVEILLLNLRGWQLREELRLNDHERTLTRREVAGWFLPVAVGLISLGLALLLPIRFIAWSGWIYGSLAVLVPLHRALSQGHRRSGENPGEG